MPAFARLYARASGMPLLVALLVVTFAIAGDLAHEAWATARVQRETADRALRDYTRFAALAMGDRARTNISTGLVALLGGLGTSRGVGTAGPPPSENIIAANAERIRRCQCALSIPTRFDFRLDLRPSRDTLRVAGDAAEVSTAELDWLRDTVAAHVRTVRRADWDMVVIHGTIPAVLGDSTPRGRMIGYTVLGDSAGRPANVYGVVSTDREFGEAVFSGLAHENRPAADSEEVKVSYDSLVSAAVIDRRGDPIFDVNPRRPTLEVAMMPRVGHETYEAGAAAVQPVTLFADTVSLGNQFGGLMLRVALNSSAPARLVSNGLPRSRLLVLFGLLVLMAGLVAVAILQLRREHELARLRAEFTTSVSHELRTPLAQILLYGETLILERTRSERERRSAAEVIVREARRLMHLVENTLHFARSERQLLELKPEPVALAALTREIMVTFAPLAWAADVTLHEKLEDGVAVLIDRDAYRQILLNLLDNAVKYGPPGQAVTVRLWREDARVFVAVEDQGPGVSAADRHRIWTPFVRGSATPAPRASQTGTGIGLAVVRDLITRHGGRASVEDRPGGGARFVVELPATDIAVERVTSESRQSSLTQL